MDSTVDLNQMSAEQLAEALGETQLQLDDLLEERRFTLGQTGIHLGAGELARLRASWEREEARLTARLTAIKARLAALSASS